MGRWLVVIGVVLLTGCQSVGPGLMQRDQVDYTAALLEAEKRQLLLNIVRLRYGDIPSLVRVDQIVAGYERRIVGSIGSTFATDFAFTDDFAVRAEGQFADRPTYTLRPLQGADYARYMLRPIPPRELVGLIAGGARLHTALGLAVQRVNRVPNDNILPGGDETTLGPFWTIVTLMEELRNDGLLQIEFELAAEEKTERVYVSFLRGEGDDQRAGRLIARLGLDPGADRYEVVLAVAPANGREIALWTRSLIEILADVAVGIDVDAGENAEAPLPPRLVGRARVEGGQPFRIRVSGGPLAPDDTFTRVRYDDRWYWIDRANGGTTRAFSMLLLLSTILERDDRGTGAVLTIPAN